MFLVFFFLALRVLRLQMFWGALLPYNGTSFAHNLFCYGLLAGAPCFRLKLFCLQWGHASERQP